MKIYLAPLEGVTDNIYRNTFYRCYGGVDKMFTPFLSPNSTKKFPLKEWENIDPEINDTALVVPQLLCCDSEHFLWAAEEIAGLGFKEINLNLGCPSGTVVAKKKGSGFLFYSDELDRFLYDIYEGADKLGIELSVKTRIGKVDESEWEEILKTYNKYPISELTVHPRLTKDFYKGEIRMKSFEYAYENSRNPLVYNGDLNSVKDIRKIESEYPGCTAVMLGRGLIAHPNLAREAAGKEKSPVSFREFHDELFRQYENRLSGETPLLHRMKEMWTFWKEELCDTPEKEKVLKSLMKAKRLGDYKAFMQQLMN
ncbi:MAG: tRNA-dihydrouridine synthase family protein [Pseudobutyrivibrio sp.]|nr:tRNA-dihydrouridine synthase family protein [Pseudobutyrivibrio sp.]